jgi:NDP-sugar pyrophosphorylase family protein
MSETKILVMCGGRGKRLNELTKSTPKPLVKFRGRTILEFKIEQYVEQGFRDFIFCLGFEGDKIREAVDQIDLDFNASFSEAGVESGILERLYHAREHFDEHVLVTYGDTFTDMDIRALVAEHLQGDNEATIVAAPFQSPFGLVEFDQDNKVTFFKEKPTLNYYIGYAMVNKTAFELVPRKVVGLPDGSGLVTFYKILIGMEKLGLYFHSGLQVTFNTEDELKAAEKELVRFYSAKD